MADLTIQSRGIAWAGVVNLAGGATGSLIGLLLAAVIGRHLGTEGAGTYFLVVAVFMIVSNVTELGADTGLVRYVSAARARGRLADVPALVRMAVAPVLITGVVLVAVVAGATSTYPDLFAPLPGGLIVIAAGVAVLSALLAVTLAISRGLGDVVSYPLLQNITLPVMRLLGVGVAVLAGWGVIGVLGSWLAPVAVVLALAVAAVARLTTRHAGSLRVAPVRPSDRRRLSAEFWGFSATRGVAAAVEILLEWMDVILVGALASPAQAGIYAVVTRCARAGEVIQQAARVAVGPQISAALARGATHEAREIYGLVTATMIWLAWPFFLVLAIFGDTVLSLFGPGFSDGATSLAVLSLAMALATAAGTVQTILLMGGRSSWQLADKSLALTLNIALDLVLIPLWGIDGAALAWAITIVIDTVVVVWQVQGLMGVSPAGRHLWSAAALAIGVAGTLTVGSRIAFGSSLSVMLGTIATVAVVYLVVSWPLRHRLGLVALAEHRS
ncbi:oligosaccharide flippase family protein [Aeromicrobium sp. A1-2]|uniref:oligosaccharide flippase family protein n=1 Tax=Aeromicrobium sp. A1-2 TaxID=2107713 RepID=UPI0013C331E8|nr:oligosaccharide flippase family protein [Aeromicrobium sp. A1-2]